MGRGGRLAIVGVLFAVAVGLVVFTVMAFLRSSPPTVDFTSGHQPGPPSTSPCRRWGPIGFGPHPTWVSYLTETPSGQWVHTTLWDVPAHTRINMTDRTSTTAAAPLRNQQWGRITGTLGGDATLNGKTVERHQLQLGATAWLTPSPSRHSGSACRCTATARVPTSVRRHPARPSHRTTSMTFSFMTPGPGQYPWQCFVPCGLGYLYGNGGPDADGRVHGRLPQGGRHA